ncbi:MAG: dihydroorotase [Eubacteriales bacterium]
MILIKAGKIVDEKKTYTADILIENGMIKKIGEGISQDNAEIIDASGLTIIPGMIDMHCHLREPGQEYKEDILSGSQAAVKGGFTSIVCMPNTDPVIDNAGLIGYVQQKAKEANLCKVYPTGAITSGLAGAQLSEMGEMKAAGAVAFTDDGKPVMSGKMMRNALNYAKSLGALLILHEEDLDIKADGVMNEGYYSSVLGLRGINRAAEESMIARDIALAESLDCKIHIAHVSTRGGFDIIKKAKERGVKVTCETMPHYFSADDSWVVGYDANTKVNPPLRTKDDVLATIEAIKDGTVDAIATDHAPHHVDEKDVEYDIAAFGISGFETALSLIVTNLLAAGISLNKIVALTSVNPAGILGLSGGEIAEGKIADLTLFDENETYEFMKESMVSRGKNSPFIGKTLTGKVKYTLVNGEIKYKE